MDRVSKTNYYLDIAQTVAERSTCLRRKFGAIIVSGDVIVSTGYNGAPRGRKNCSDICECRREKLKIPRGERYELCRSVHAEQNAIIAASLQQMNGATMYLSCVSPEDGKILGGTCCCALCKRLILNAGISKVIVREDKDNFTVVDTSSWIYNDDTLGDTMGY